MESECLIERMELCKGLGLLMLMIRLSCDKVYKRLPLRAPTYQSKACVNITGGSVLKVDRCLV